MKNKIVLRIFTIVLAIGMLGFGFSTAEAKALTKSEKSEINKLVIKTLYNNKGGKMTCDFDGYKNTKGRHEGIDYKLKEGANIYSIISGEVINVVNTNSNSKLSTLAIYDAENKKTVIYLHSKKICVKKGQSVKKGQKVAKEGNRAGGSAHTHIEVRKGKKTSAAKSVNDYKLENESPYAYFKKVLKKSTTVTKAPKVKANKSTYAVGEKAKITWNKVENATGYTVKISGPKGYSKSAKVSKSKKTGNKTFKVKIMVTEKPTVKTDKSGYTAGQSAKIGWNKVKNATSYKLKISGPSGYSYSAKVSGSSSYTVKNLKVGKYTATVTASNKNSKTSQSKSFIVNYASNKIHPKGSQTISNGTYHVVSALNAETNLNVKSYSKSNGANIQLWQSINDSRQTFNITYLGNGYYKIISTNSGKSLDIKSGSLKAGANVQQWGYSGTNNQQWVIREAGDGTFYIISKHNSLYLDVAGGSAKNGANIQVNTANGSKAQKWNFIAYGGSTGKTVKEGTYHVVSALNTSKNLDVKSLSTSNGANIQLWGTLHDSKQRFKLSYLGKGYYKLVNVNSGKCLDVKSAGTKSGSNVQQWTYCGNNNQQWIVKSAGSGYYYIIAKNSGLYLDVAGGKTNNGTNIQVYIGNPTKSQKWKFVK